MCIWICNRRGQHMHWKRYHTTDQRQNQDWTRSGKFTKYPLQKPPSNILPCSQCVFFKVLFTASDHYFGFFVLSIKEKKVKANKRGVSGHSRASHSLGDNHLFWCVGLKWAKTYKKGTFSVPQNKLTSVLSISCFCGFVFVAHLLVILFIFHHQASFKWLFQICPRLWAGKKKALNYLQKWLSFQIKFPRNKFSS